MPVQGAPLGNILPQKNNNVVSTQAAREAIIQQQLNKAIQTTIYNYRFEKQQR